jgi:predicted DNA-binding antitoxin AbrB/MazE fold protein
MTEISAIYQGGVFRTEEDVPLREGQRVVLSVRPVEPEDWRGWLDRVGAVHRDILARRGGPLPDSTAEIAEDRMRDI